jgi:septum formation topological specificity factor MinE
MKYKLLSKRYDDLEAEVMEALREEILDSEIESKHMQTNVIKVNVFDYTELAVVNDELTFLDDNGLHYGIYSECSLEDLIDILNKL